MDTTIFPHFKELPGQRFAYAMPLLGGRGRLVWTWTSQPNSYVDGW